MDANTWACVAHPAVFHAVYMSHCTHFPSTSIFILQLPDTVLGAVTNMVAETVLENMGGDDDSSSDSGGEN